MGKYTGCNPDEIGREKDKRIAELEGALREAVGVWASYLNMMPSIGGRRRLDEVRALLSDES